MLLRNIMQLPDYTALLSRRRFCSYSLLRGPQISIRFPHETVGRSDLSSLRHAELSRGWVHGMLLLTLIILVFLESDMVNVVASACRSVRVNIPFGWVAFLLCIRQVSVWISARGLWFFVRSLIPSRKMSDSTSGWATTTSLYVCSYFHIL
jgi:hypothetical protein